MNEKGICILSITGLLHSWTHGSHGCWHKPGLPAADQGNQHSSGDWRGAYKLHRYLRSCWQLMGVWLGFLKDVAPGRFTRLQWMVIKIWIAQIQPGGLIKKKKQEHKVGSEWAVDLGRVEGGAGSGYNRNTSYACMECSKKLIKVFLFFFKFLYPNQSFLYLLSSQFLPPPRYPSSPSPLSEDTGVPSMEIIQPWYIKLLWD